MADTAKKKKKSKGEIEKSSQKPAENSNEKPTEKSTAITPIDAWTVTDLVMPVPVQSESIVKLVMDILAQMGQGFRGDVMSVGISLPSWMYEPLTILQRGVELFQWAELLDKAYECKDPLNRLAYVAAFMISPYAVTPDRFKTFFNPIVGETFEYVDRRQASPVKIFFEQISHHPPLSATHAENDNWKLDLTTLSKTNFLGNMLDIDTDCRNYIEFKDTGDRFFMVNERTTRIHNLVMPGTTMWIEHFGDLIIENLKTGDTCKGHFPQSGWFSGVQTSVTAGIYNKKGTKVIELSGDWTKDVNAKWVDDTEDFKKGTTKNLWTTIDHGFENKPYRLTDFALSFNYFPEPMQKVILPTDSRRRLDRQCLEQGKAAEATKWKQAAEVRQRAEEKAAKAEKRVWEPVWFKQKPDHKGVPMWIFTDEYWPLREKREKRVLAGKDPGELITAEHVKDTAADFANYQKNFPELVEPTLRKSSK